MQMIVCHCCFDPKALSLVCSGWNDSPCATSDSMLFTHRPTEVQQLLFEESGPQSLSRPEGPNVSGVKATKYNRPYRAASSCGGPSCADTASVSDTSLTGPVGLSWVLLDITWAGRMIKFYTRGPENQFRSIN